MSLSIAVLQGGISNERPVSLSSGIAVAEALRRKGHRVVSIDVGPDIVKTINDLRSAMPNVVFNALHGPLGEDGAIQGVLELLQIPYTHSSIKASALAMDKDSSRRIFAAAHLPIAQGGVYAVSELRKADPLPRPYVIKPIAEGSSFGVKVIHEASPSHEQIASEWSFGDDVLIEEYIPGHELTVGVLGDRALTVTDIIAHGAEGEFYDFDAKYRPGGSLHRLPAKMPQGLFEQALFIAKKAHAVLGCAGATRADIRYDEAQQKLVLLEVNTQPGMTTTSLLPEQASFCGIGYDDLCEWMILDAQTRHHAPHK